MELTKNKQRANVSEIKEDKFIAEMVAMLNCLQFGILNEFINSVRYLKSWRVHNSQDRETAIRKAFIESKKSKNIWNLYNVRAL